MDGVVVDLLDQSVRAARHVDPAEDLQEGPGHVLPALVRVWVPVPLLAVDGLEPGPEDRHEDHSPARVLPLVVGPEDRAEHLVLAWILRRAVPHERDHFRPPVEAAEEKVLPLQFPKERLIGAILELLFEPFTVFMSWAHEAPRSEITAKAVETELGRQDVAVAAWNLWSYGTAVRGEETKEAGGYGQSEMTEATAIRRTSGTARSTSRRRSRRENLQFPRSWSSGHRRVRAWRCHRWVG